jgi:hypothetical protein
MNEDTVLSAVAAYQQASKEWSRRRAEFLAASIAQEEAKRACEEAQTKMNFAIHESLKVTP